MSEWQPIKTAPKDGTWILAASDEQWGDYPQIGIVQWYKLPEREEYRPHPTVRDAFVKVRVEPDCEGWWDGGPVSPFRATHWTPLPKPPVDTDGEA